jgi:hypothetical protein
MVPFGWRRRLPPSPPKPRTGDEAGGAGSNRTSVPGRGHDTTALFWTQCQSFLDNIVAGFRPKLSLNDPCPRRAALCTGTSMKRIRAIIPYLTGTAARISEIEQGVGPETGSIADAQAGGQRDKQFNCGAQDGIGRNLFELTFRKPAYVA